MTRATIAVIGGGVTGLVAARRLALLGHDVELFEGADRLGGQIRTVDLAGQPVDVGAESLHLAGPAIASLIDELGLADQVVMADSSHAWLWDGSRRRRLPAGVGPAGPTRLPPLIRARVLSPLGMARAAFEPLVPADTGWDAAGGDVAVGPFIARRFGRQVVDRLVDPVLGSLHSGDVDRLSLRAATPMLAARATKTRSLLVAPSKARGAAPGFASFPGGLAVLIDRLLQDTGVRVHLGAAVSGITRDGTSYAVHGASAEPGCFDAVLVALPAAPAARVLEPLAAPVAAELAPLRTASVATIALAYRPADLAGEPALEGTGILSSSKSGSLLKAATFLSTKWPHLREGPTVLRLSAGRVDDRRVAELDDGTLVDRMLAELEHATGIDAEPTVRQVHRWPSAIPQLEVGHLDRLAAIRAGLDAHPGVALAGAAYTGLGIASCVTGGARAADDLCAAIGMTTEAPT
jgi:oxygen-dependent protoporphyrinogen oxidase